MASIHDVASRTGFSTATVSRALRGFPNVLPETRALVEAAAKELGYVPSSSAVGLSSGLHRAVAVVVPSIGRWFYTEVIEGADSVLRRAGYDVFLIDLEISASGRDRLFHNTMLRKRADAVMALGIDFAKDERHELRSLSMPSIIIGGFVRGVRNIGLDDDQATRLAMEHLLSLGHRHIAHVGGENEYGVLFSVAQARRHAWAATLAEHAIDAPADWFVSGGFTLPKAKGVAQSLLTRTDRPTAVFAGSDEMAFGILLAAAELGIDVPGDLSVVGIDDHEWSGAFGLTTVRQDAREQGAEAARILLADLAGTPPKRRSIRVDGTFVERRTTAAPGTGVRTEASSSARVTP